MRAGLAIVAGLTAACGRVAFDGRTDAGAPDGITLADGAGDATTCPAASSWGPPQALTQLNSTGEDWTPALRPDGRAIVFTSNRDGTFDVFMAFRPTVSDPFGAPVKVSLSTTGDEETDTAWNGTGDQVFYIHYNGAAMTGGNYVAAYLGDAAFGTPMDADPVVPHQALTFSTDNLELFATSEPTPGNQRLVHYTRPAIAAAWTQLTDVDALNVANAQGWPSFDETRQDLYFERAQPTHIEIVVTHRAAPGAPFETPAAAVSLGGVAGVDDGDPEVSRDGTTLVFASDRPGGLGGQDLYIATRTCM